MRIASFDVDAQKGFTPLCPDELPVPEGDQIVDALNEQASIADVRIGSKDAHPIGALWEATEDKPVFSIVGHDNVDIRWPRHCVVGTKGFELLDGLPAVEEYDFFVYKGLEKNLHPYSAVYHDLQLELSTGVIEYLKDQKIDTVIVGGLAYSFCVKQTAVDLVKAGFKVIVNKQATRDIPGYEEETEKEFQKYGVIISNNVKSFT